MARAALELLNVTLKVEQRCILKDVSLQVPRGERLVFIGPSGHGKSVLLKVMAGLLAPTSGSVFVEGEDLYSVPNDRKSELMRKMGMLFQKNALFDSLTVADNIAFPLREAGTASETEIERIVCRFLDAVGIAQAARLFPDEISGGMQKRLGIARALALNPHVVFFDDPTAGLDPITSRKITDLILSLQIENGSTLVAITNEMARAYQLAQTIAMVVDNTILVTGSPDETRSHPDPRVHQFIHGHLKGPLSEAQA